MTFGQLAAWSFHLQWETTRDSVLLFIFTKVSKPRHAKLDSKVNAWAQEEKQPGIQRHSSTRAMRTQQFWKQPYYCTRA